MQSILLFKRNLLQPPGLKARNMSNPSGRYILCYLHSCLNFGWPQVLNWKGGHLAVFECVGTRYISMQKIDLFRFRFSPTVNKVATPKLKGNQPKRLSEVVEFQSMVHCNILSIQGANCYFFSNFWQHVSRRGFICLL